MKYFVLFILVVVSFAGSRLLLWLINPNDPEGTNLLITSVVAAIIFVLLWLGYRLIFDKHGDQS